MGLSDKKEIGMASGPWVVRAESRTRIGRLVASWWYGPSHGWGTTYGAPQDAKQFKTKVMAEQAHRNVYGSLTQRYRAQRLSEALAERDARIQPEEAE